MNSVVVSVLGSPYRLSRNPLTPNCYGNSSDPDWHLLERAPYPYALPRTDRLYDCLCTRLVRTEGSKSKTSFSSVKWFPDSRRLMTTALSGELAVWSGETFTLEDIKRLPASSGGLTVTEWLADGSMALVGDWGGNIHLTSETLSPIALLTDMTGHPVLNLSVAPTSVKFAAVGMDAYPMIWDLPSQTMERSLSALGYDAVCLQWHPSKGMIATGSKSDQLTFWDPRVGHLAKVIMAHKGSLTALQFSPCGHLLATSGRDALIRIWELRKMTYLHSFRTAGSVESRVTQLKWHPVYTSQIILSGDSEGNLHQFDLSLSPTALTTLTRYCPTPLLASVRGAHEQQVTGADFHPLAHVLSTVGAEGKLKIWAPALDGNLDPPVKTDLVMDSVQHSYQHLVPAD